MQRDGQRNQEGAGNTVAQRHSPNEGSARGRPKDAKRRDAVLAATRELLIAKGYDEVTLSEAARVAGVSRPFVYDNWGTKFGLVEDAIFDAPKHASETQDDKPFADALTDLIADMVAVQSDPAYLAGLPGLSAELYNRPDLVEQIETRYIAPARATYVRLIESAKAAGIVRPEVDGSALLDTVRGAVMLHTLVNTALGQDQLVAHLSSLILHGVTVQR
jgi:AcrR family transcriptional regulator